MKLFVHVLLRDIFDRGMHFSAALLSPLAQAAWQFKDGKCDWENIVDIADDIIYDFETANATVFESSILLFRAKENL